MSKSKHSPGKWRVTVGRYGMFNVMRGRNYIAQQITADGDGEAEANATLIAAAPELLAALEAVESLADEAANFVSSDQILPCDDGDEIAERLASAAMHARAAIAKATGG